MQGEPAIDIVIVNWNAGPLLRRTLRSLARCPDAAAARVIVVDNASTDDSLTDLPDAPFTLRLIRNDTNRGFAAACNQGAAAGDAPFLLFLNPDMVVEPGALAATVAYMERPGHDHVAACGIQLVDEDGNVARTCSRSPRPFDVFGRTLLLDRFLPRLVRPHFLVEWDHAETRPVEQVIGAYLMVRRRVFEELHGFDERFFVYYEEVDLAVRTAAAGYQLHYLAHVRSTHTGTGTTDAIRATRQFYVSRSRLAYARKHFGAGGRAAALLGMLVLEPLLRCIGFAARGDLRSARESLQAGIMLWRDHVRPAQSSTLAPHGAAAHHGN